MPPPVSTIRRSSIAEILVSSRTQMIPLVAVLLDTYGTEALEWDHVTIWGALEEDFKTRLPRLSRDKLMAGVVLLTTEQLYESAEHLNVLAAPLNGRPAAFEIYTPAEPREVAWAVVQVSLLLGDDYSPDKFSDEVRQYVGLLLDNEGIRDARPPLQFAIMPERQTGDVRAPVDIEMGQRRQLRAWEGIENYVQTELSRLLDQLDTLPLSNRNPEWDEVAKRLRRRIVMSGS